MRLSAVATQRGIVGRLRLCVAGYLASAIAASLGIVGCLMILQQVEAETLEDLLRLPGAALALLLRSLPGILYATILLTVLPSALFVLFAEIAGWRGWRPYVSFGALLGPGLIVYLSGKAPSPDDSLLAAMAVSSGALAGLAYWLVAIRWPLSRSIGKTHPTAE
jgi:hypothetical protein